MKKIIIIMLVLMTVGIVWAYDGSFFVHNNSSKIITVGLIQNGGSIQQPTTLSPHTACYLNGLVSVTYDIKAVVGSNINILIPGYYEIQTHTLLPGGTSNNIISFEFSNLNPVDPGDPGQNQ